jgi:histidinol-phosphate aminotransferase
MTPEIRPRPRPNSRVAGLRSYRRAPLPPFVDLRLDGNEGPHPDAALWPPPDVRVLREYPDAGRVEAAYARSLGLADDRVAVFAGGDEVLDRVFRAFTEPGEAVAFTEPTFELIAHYARLAGVGTANITWDRGAFPTAALCRLAGPACRVAFVVSPNNPTGLAATRADVEAVLDRFELVVLDHAYVEFADEDLTDLVRAHDHLLVLRTLSKAYGLAGLRAGFAIGHPEVLGALRAAGGPFSVAGPSLCVAERAIERGVERNRIDAVRAERARLQALLERYGYEVSPSQANFVLARGPRSASLRRDLAALGIQIRSFAGRPLLDDAVRIACAARDAERLEHALRTIHEPEAMLFDLDGVLVDVSGSYRQAILQTAEHFGVRLTAADVARAKASGRANDDWSLTQRLIRDVGVEVDLAEVTAVFERLYQGDDGTPGLRTRERLAVAPEWLSELADRLPLAVVTGRPRIDAERALATFGIAERFRVLVCREDAPLKPDPAPVRLALRTLGVERAWMFGDTRDDLDAARAAGVLPIGVVAPGEDRERARAALERAGAARVLDRVDQGDER